MLYLLPNLLVETSCEEFLAAVHRAVMQITGLIVESEKEGRRFLKRFEFAPPKTFRDIPLKLLNEHSSESDKKELLKEIEKGIWGLISDCGMPCLADPGADLVLKAREKKIPIETFAGPSSIVFALVLSGLGGQRFTFHGYLPKEEGALIEAIRSLEKTSSKEKSTHLFIETPYRNLKMYSKLLSVLSEETWLCIACNLSAADQEVQTQKVGIWKKGSLPNIDKKPAVFLIRA